MRYGKMIIIIGLFLISAIFVTSDIVKTERYPTIDIFSAHKSAKQEDWRIVGNVTIGDKNIVTYQQLVCNIVEKQVITDLQNFYYCEKTNQSIACESVDKKDCYLNGEIIKCETDWVMR